LVIRDAEASLFTGGIAFLSASIQHQSTDRLMVVSFYRQRDVWPATQPALSMHNSKQMNKSTLLWGLHILASHSSAASVSY